MGWVNSPAEYLCNFADNEKNKQLNQSERDKQPNKTYNNNVNIF